MSENDIRKVMENLNEVFTEGFALDLPDQLRRFTPSLPDKAHKIHEAKSKSDEDIEFQHKKDGLHIRTLKNGQIVDHEVHSHHSNTTQTTGESMILSDHKIDEWRDYTKLAVRTAPDAAAIASSKFPSGGQQIGASWILQGALTVAGEISEYYRSDDVPLEEHIYELGDVYWGLALITEGVARFGAETGLALTMPLRRFDATMSDMDALLSAYDLLEAAESLVFQDDVIDQFIRAAEQPFHRIFQYLSARPDTDPAPSVRFVLEMNVRKLELRHLEVDDE